MLGIFLKILAILGWLLLAMVILLLIILLLVMIYPVNYRLWWEKCAENMLVKVKVSWLLGLLKLSFEYPSWGTVIVKLLGFTMFDSAKASKKPIAPKTADPQTPTDSSGQVSKNNNGRSAETHVPPPAKTVSRAEEESKPGIIERIRIIVEKLFNKLRQINDKIKNILESAEYYLNLLKEEDTRALFFNVLLRSGKILKCIRPRKIQGQILLGTGSPDTTGYAMAVYGILSPYLGQNLVLTPDFEEKVLEGQLLVKGRITVGILLINGLKVAFDRRLRSFVKKMKREGK